MAIGEEGTSTGNSPRILSSKEEKRAFCGSFGRARRKHFLLAYPYPESLNIPWEKIKSEKTFEEIRDEGLASLAGKHAVGLEYAAIVEEIVRGQGSTTTRQVRMALHLRSEGEVFVRDILWMLYDKVFPEYPYRIQLDLADSSKYLTKARDLVAPLKAREMDMEPCVSGDKDAYALLMRMENEGKDAKRTTKIDGNWWRYPLGLRRAALDANGSWLIFIGSGAYAELGAKYPFTCRLVFDRISKLMRPTTQKRRLEHQAQTRDLICGSAPKRLKARDGGPATSRCLNFFREKNGEMTRALEN